MEGEEDQMPVSACSAHLMQGTGHCRGIRRSEVGEKDGVTRGGWGDGTGRRGAGHGAARQLQRKGRRCTQVCLNVTAARWHMCTQGMS